MESTLEEGSPPDNFSGATEYTAAPSDWFDKGDCAELSVEDVVKESAVTLQPIAETSNAVQVQDRVAPKRKNSRRRKLQAQQQVGSPLPSPSWNELSSQVIPKAAKELLSSSVSRVCYLSRKTYANSRSNHNNSELGNVGGYFRTPRMGEAGEDLALPQFSSLPWVDRQLVQEWRTYEPGQDYADNKSDDEDEDDFARARTLVPAPVQRPKWRHADSCRKCRVVFGPTKLRHHCRNCGNSFCQVHSGSSHPLLHLGYLAKVPERVCDDCKVLLMSQNLAERVAWRKARCRDCIDGNLAPYFEVGVDTIEDVLLRVTEAALHMAKSVPLGAQATVAVETVDVLRKHGLNGIYTIMLRKEFLAAADLLRKALGINRTAWPLSVHELTAAIFYSLAQHRALRGINPEREEWIHRTQLPECTGETVELKEAAPAVGRDIPERADSEAPSCTDASVEAVCKPISDEELSSLIFYAPIALNFIYAAKEVDMQLLAAQQGWRLAYAYLDQEVGHNEVDRPASALFVHETQKIACLAIRGTTTIQDIVTDIRQTPVPFPQEGNEPNEQGWTTVSRGQGLAVSGMAGAAANLYQEHADALIFLAREGYRVRLTGHSLGGGVAALLGALLIRDLHEHSLDQIENPPLRVYTYGTTACVDSDLSEYLSRYVVSVVHHDDVVPRMTPASCRELLKHLLHIRETWVKEHLENDLLAVTERARSAWAPRWRSGFTLTVNTSIKGYYPSSSSLRRYYRQKLQKSYRKIRQIKDSLMLSKDQSGHESTAEELLPNETEISHDPKSQLDKSAVGIVVTPEDAAKGDDDTVWQEPKMLVDFLGHVSSENEGLVIDGDEFFDSEDALLDSESDGSVTSDLFDDAIDESIALERNVNAHKGDLEALESLHEEPDMNSVESSNGDKDDPGDMSKGNESEGSDVEGDEEEEDAGGMGAVVLQDTPLPRMYVPGNIVHVYSHRGVYKAAFVPRNFREIRRITMAGNMLSDHKCDEYYHALLEVRTVRKASETAPAWASFDEDSTCSCCRSLFTWASTSNSEAQEARDKHNCRSCGTLVCDPCSRNRIPVPSIGLTMPGRVCDRCYNDIDGVANGSISIPKTTLSGNVHDTNISDPQRTGGVEEKRPERQRPRQSAIVDELVNKVRSSPLKCP